MCNGKCFYQKGTISCVIKSVITELADHAVGLRKVATLKKCTLLYMTQTWIFGMPNHKIAYITPKTIQNQAILL